MRCVWCNKHIWFRRESLAHSSHKVCNKVWHAGYNAAMRFATTENKIHGFPVPVELYHKRMMDMKVELNENNS